MGGQFTLWYRLDEETVDSGELFVDSFGKGLESGGMAAREGHYEGLRRNASNFAFPLET